MRTTTTTLFLLSALIISYLPSTTLALESIVDIDGDALVNGGTYYILPIIRGMGGGIEIAATENETCPLTVVQSRMEVSKGLPIIISSLFEISHLHEALPLELSFQVVPTCAPTPSNWTIVNGLSKGPSVKITGYENTKSGSFKIAKYLSDYKLTFCVDNQSGSCSDIGVYIDDDGYRHLVETNSRPLRVQFQKVLDSSSHVFA